MKKITCFVISGCPYCAKARKALEELAGEDARYGRVEIDFINEEEEPELADRYDYHHVPTMFIDQDKLYEASPKDGYEEIKAGVKRVLETALA